MSELVAGESVLVIDDKGRHYLVRLQPGSSFKYHRGVLPHDDIIGQTEGVTMKSSSGGSLTILRPRLADYILKMKRGAQVVYPKDIGPILTWADIAPGMSVLEAGTGSGALAIALSRAVGEHGHVLSVERREDHAEQARKIIKRWFGEIPPQLELRVADLEEVILGYAPERIVLDVPEPWHAAEMAADRQEPGGIFCSYLPTIPQVQMLVETLERTGAYAEIEVFETLHRGWNISGRSVRPDHQMVGHTGFVVTARRIVA